MLTCGTCKHYDPVMRGNNKGLRPTIWGWCSIQSVYPMKEGPGQLFPAGVKRMDTADKPCKPKIVRLNQVEIRCNKHIARPAAPTKQALLDKVKKSSRSNKKILE